MSSPISMSIAAFADAFSAFMSYSHRSTYSQRQSDPSINDFTFGNPHDMPIPEYVAALQRATIPQSADWFAYKTNEQHSRAIIAESLHGRFSLPFESDDIFVTTAGFGAMVVAMKAVVDSGDEVIFNLPPWFGYAPMTVNVGAVPVKVPIDRETFDLDLDAIEAAITPRTRMVIINTPCNPTGKIYSPATLERLARLLEEASRRNGRTIYLLSDEAYNRIIFDGNEFHTPLEFYPNAMLAYSYGKQLLAPGQRIGYLALSPTMTEIAAVRAAVETSQFVGYFFPNAVLQYALADLEQITIDMERMQRKRDRMVSALRGFGYDIHSPEGTFYLFPRTPWTDDYAFVDLLEKQDTFVLPGEMFEFSGHFRISLTANEEMIERSLPAFAAAIEHARTHDVPQLRTSAV